MLKIRQNDIFYRNLLNLSFRNHKLNILANYKVLHFKIKVK